VSALDNKWDLMFLMKRCHRTIARVGRWSMPMRHLTNRFSIRCFLPGRHGPKMRPSTIELAETYFISVRTFAEAS